MLKGGDWFDIDLMKGAVESVWTEGFLFLGMVLVNGGLTKICGLICFFTASALFTSYLPARALCPVPDAFLVTFDFWFLPAFTEGFLLLPLLALGAAFPFVLIFPLMFILPLLEALPELISFTFTFPFCFLLSDFKATLSATVRFK